ncbi:unnamed protein product [Rotaria sordida]|uniref:EF-hand domain-containing protein n=1 Tax=Rotaria sordida TaxID=392033 RepID=A0A815KPR4_9BILA|nr:unnamed protein product [Rotaria sordida]
MWGANVAATFEQVVENHDQVQTVEGSLSVVLKSLPISGEAKLDLQNKDSSKLENLQISFSSDLLIDECPQNIEQTETESNDTAPNSAFMVIDYDLHHSDLENDDNRAEKCCIYYAKRGAIKSKDYYEDSLKKLSHKQISSILKENSRPSGKEIVNWHKAFMDEHPTGELTEDDFISELTKLYENGNATHYADFVFTATDKDRSGTISFCEFMSAVALTSKGNAENVEKRLGLIFHVIVGNSKSGAEFQGLVKFIEAVTTLVKGEDAVNTSDIKGIVKQMFKICKKDADDGDLSKEEFINCCLWQKGKIGCAFLPDIPGKKV